MSRSVQFLVVLCLTTVPFLGCSSTSPLALRPASEGEAVIRDGLWSQSTLVRGASPDDTTATLITGDTSRHIRPVVSTSAYGMGAISKDAPSPVASDGRLVMDPSCCIPPRCAPFSFADDCNDLMFEFCRDVDAVLNCHNLGALLVAGGVSYIFHETIDDDVAESFERHPNRWGSSQEFFAALGNPSHHFAVIGGLYLYSLHTQDAEIHDLSKSLFNAVAITGLSTVALKATIGRNTTAPNGEPDPFGGAWPSGHTSSAFAFAAVLDQYYGPTVGIPAYILAGLVGWERIDDGEHDLSDVVFGAALGFVIGKTVAAEHLRFCGMELQPLVDLSTGSTGLCLERRF